MRPLTFACVLTVLAALAAPARGQTSCPVADGVGDPTPTVGGGPARIDGRARLGWIDAHLMHTARSARRWTWGWGVGIGVATVANLAPLPFVARADRIDWYTGAATTAVGVVPLLIAPLDVVEDSRALHASLSDDDRRDLCAQVADAERRLVRDAKNQADGQRWWLHAGNVALNVGVGLFLGLGYHHWGAGALNAVSGSIIGEAIILTQPTGTIEDLRRYRAGLLEGEGE